MQKSENKNDISKLLKQYSSSFDYSVNETAVILAAGHGKRIKSNTSKMLHTIWNVPTVERVYNACGAGLKKVNRIMVVGIKAKDVVKVIGVKKNTLFAHQAQQNGTGHAVKIGLELIKKNYKGTVYVFPGDMGLIDGKTVKMFKDEFKKSKSDMMVLTGIFEGKPEDNNYGRIVRVKEFDDNGRPSGKDYNKVIEIIEHKDILSMKDNEMHSMIFNKRKYSYTKKELIENNEFNSGVYAFKYNYLSRLINKIKSNNAQNEIYITDLISIFNMNGLNVSAVYPNEQHVIMGFNDKYVLSQMEFIAQKIIYEKLKNIVEIEDPRDFFIDETIVEEILKADKKGIPLDIKIGRGVYIGKGVKLNYNTTFKKNVKVEGNIIFGHNVTIHENASLTCFPDQKIEIGDNVEIFWNNTLKGNIKLGEATRIESIVDITGSDEHKVIIGKNVVIKGTSYIYGSELDDNILIEHSVLKRKKIINTSKNKKDRMKIRFYIPTSEGADLITDLK
ncbi:MAG: NTP transferase domain-containing protein [Bacteroidetes bacterium]|nr:NTP transferase domain-containing protein [Bacteroidota bacterium]